MSKSQITDTHMQVNDHPKRKKFAFKFSTSFPITLCFLNKLKTEKIIEKVHKSFTNHNNRFYVSMSVMQPIYDILLALIDPLDFCKRKLLKINMRKI